MAVVVIFIPFHLRAYTSGASEVEAEGTNVRECLVDLVSRFPGLSGRLLSADGSIRNFVIYINRREACRGELNKPVHHGDELYILPVIGGG